MLLQQGHLVTAVARTTEQQASLAAKDVTVCDSSLFDRDGLSHAMRGHDTVINLATHIPHSSLRMMIRRNWRENDRIRSEGSANIVHAATACGVQTLIQESFAPIYESGGDRWLDESSSVRAAPYNESTLDAERSAERFAATGGKSIVLRFAAFYGADAFHVRDLVRAIRMGWAPLPGAPDAYWSSVCHNDAATAVVAALGAPAGVYNVVDDEPLQRSEFFRAIADAFELKSPRVLPTWMSKLMGSTGELLSRSLRISNKKLHTATGWNPAVRSAQEGFHAIALDWKRTRT